MRDLIVVLIVAGSLPVIFMRPYVGVLVWTWLSLMNPHRLTWGFAYNMRLALAVAAVTILAWLFSKEPKRPPMTRAVILLALFTFWMTLTLPFSVLFQEAFTKWQEVIKILGFTFLIMCLIQCKERIDQLVWAIVVSLGFYGVKGGIFTVLTGGNNRVYGPSGSFIADNNAMALALVMIIPLMQYLQLQSRNRWIKMGLWAAMGLTVFAVLGTYSRGGMLGLAIMLGALWLKTKHRLITGAIMAVVLAGFLAVAPQQWFDRMQSIESYEEDGSAQGRIDAWTFAFKLALDRPFVGGGLNVFGDSELFFSYVPDARGARNAHSIYFQVLGEMGFVGLAIFLMLGASTLLTARWTIKHARGDPELEWARNLSAMIQVSLVGYAVAGAFQNLGFFDLYYSLIAIVVVTAHVVQQAVGSEVSSGKQAPRSPGFAPAPKLAQPPPR